MSNAVACQNGSRAQMAQRFRISFYLKRTILNGGFPYSEFARVKGQSLFSLCGKIMRAQFLVWVSNNGEVHCRCLPAVAVSWLGGSPSFLPRSPPAGSAMAHLVQWTIWIG